MEGTVMAGRARGDRGAQVGFGPAGERRPADPHGVERVRVTVADLGQALFGRESDDGPVTRPAQRGGVERLERVRCHERVAGVQEASKRPSLGAQRVRHQRMSRDRQRTLLVDLGDRRSQGPIRLHRRAQAERQEVAAEGRHLLADDHLERQAEILGDRPAGDGGIDALVVRDRDDVQAELHGTLEHRRHGGGPVRGDRVDVQVGAPVRQAGAAGRRPGCAPRASLTAPSRDPARSGRRRPTTGPGRPR